ncbi:hypothetical protein B0I35DRAFT_203277 [Stachybotrys elegans]|uniref:Uncharacterized protein n=1 Tax=Stachybotrys elegans TaxID=80388 RepID=A0A8K0WSL3_9HYPO|nr:hypothetical protein B0I35DRAFT_203277 [Stachybotrys elegans]
MHMLQQAWTRTGCGWDGMGNSQPGLFLSCLSPRPFLLIDHCSVRCSLSSWHAGPLVLDNFISSPYPPHPPPRTGCLGKPRNFYTLQLCTLLSSPPPFTRISSLSFSPSPPPFCLSRLLFLYKDVPSASLGRLSSPPTKNKSSSTPVVLGRVRLTELLAISYPHRLHQPSRPPSAITISTGVVLSEPLYSRFLRLQSTASTFAYSPLSVHLLHRRLPCYVTH